MCMRPTYHQSRLYRAGLRTGKCSAAACARQGDLNDGGLLQPACPRGTQVGFPCITETVTTQTRC